MEKFATLVANRVTMLVAALSGVCLFLHLFVGVLFHEERIHLTLSATDTFATASPFGQYAFHLDDSFATIWQGQQVTHLFNQPEVLTLHALIASVWLGVALLLLSAGVLLLNHRKRFKKHLAFIAASVTLLLCCDLPFFLSNGMESPVLDMLLMLGLLAAALVLKGQLNVSIQTKGLGLLAYASQTGSALQLAKQLQASTPSGWDLRCLSQLTPQCLNQYQQVHFIVSTQGDGQAPDTAIPFIKALEKTSEVSGSPFSLLALGDRHYPKFCAFGHHLADRLQVKGLQKLMPITEVDKMDMNAINTWWAAISNTDGLTQDAISIEYDEFMLTDNQYLNPTQSHRPVHWLSLSQPGLRYQAGDLLAVKPSIVPRHLAQRIATLGWSADHTVSYQGQPYALFDLLLTLDWTDESAPSPQQLVDQLKPLTERLYSIASYEADTLRLLVRQHQRQDGSIGNASGYLTEASIGTRIEASIRPHPSFHLAHEAPLIMIGAGTGLAPFIGFLQQRKAQGCMAPNWLFFGEQYQATDAYLSDELSRFEQEGILTHLTCAWSRDDGVYIQDRLTEYQHEVRSWVSEQQAHIYVCGSQKGFGEGVLALLHDWFDESVLDAQIHLDLY
ncbi:flavodoxin domain-containing protein [Nitrincola nitratireducens]|uniref:NADPH--hemoprotein reductase n=1 Tax=Nitrincola nitratireducens TaxID=1229521 RepID=W9UZ46_9GAMM|nr:flavodoxin domain-containing protein [Nitrincola nitratireducens]EXJ12513.1 Sulfite reductase [NADPH] flavoprotein alpha-component [Nitrincola nitratireducens]